MTLAPVLFLVASCAATSSPGQIVDSTGSVAGTVRFEGERPEARWIEIPEAHREDAGAERVRDESWIVAKDGGVANCVVTLRPLGDTPKAEMPVPDEPVPFAHAGGRYEPHTLVVPAGTTVAFRSVDSDCACFHTYAKKNPDLNAKVPRGEQRELVLDRAEVVRVANDLLPWMKGYVVVVDEPFFVVTGADGGFRFGGLAPGRYRLEAWHEEGGTRRETGEVVRVRPVPDSDHFQLITPSHESWSTVLRTIRESLGMR